MGAYAVMLALLERRQTGKGQFVHTSLAQTGSTFSSPYLIDHEGYERDEIEGPDTRRMSALNGLYEATDGWLVVADADWETLTGMGAFAHLSGREAFSTKELRIQNDEMLADEIEAIFRDDSVDEWLAKLGDAGVDAVRNNNIEQILSEEYPRQAGLIVEEGNALVGKVTHAGVAPRLSRTQPVLGETPIFGEETEAVLLELGYEVEKIDALRAEGVIPPLV